MAERWTTQRRLQHARNVLLAAAEERFARKEFDGAARESIAEVVGYARGTTYSHFGSNVVSEGNSS
ncbi:TetR family transcriptional regulator [Mycolicibacterium houstonense]|uniref:TetR family transcriptional regulator n=1 Tax=Mycolicibacterium houstonense TaxID=146021 RepID=UPI000829C2C0|nr:TetR family transcriptional regulator [Mycolicibacterium houstonense]